LEKANFNILAQAVQRAVAESKQTSYQAEKVADVPKESATTISPSPVDSNKRKTLAVSDSNILSKRVKSSNCKETLPMTRQGAEQMYEAQRLREEAENEVAKGKGKGKGKGKSKGKGKGKSKGKGKQKDEDAKACRSQYLEDENEDEEEEPPTKHKKTSWELGLTQLNAQQKSIRSSHN